MIGEFPAASLNGGLTDTQLYEYALAAGFDGAWGWALNGGSGIANLSPAMAAIRSRPGVPLSIAGASPPPDNCKAPAPTQPLPPQPEPACTDTPPPPGSYTCAQQSGWNKCGESFMAGFCCKTCFGCKGVLQCGGVNVNPATT